MFDEMDLESFAWPEEGGSARPTRARTYAVIRGLLQESHRSLSDEAIEAYLLDQIGPVSEAEARFYLEAVDAAAKKIEPTGTTTGEPMEPQPPKAAAEPSSPVIRPGKTAGGAKKPGPVPSANASADVKNPAALFCFLIYHPKINEILVKKLVQGLGQTKPTEGPNGITLSTSAGTNALQQMATEMMFQEEASVVEGSEVVPEYLANQGRSLDPHDPSARAGRFMELLWEDVRQENWGSAEGDFWDGLDGF